jgi:phenylalanyl-tRNA synthetase beta chain
MNVSYEWLKAFVPFDQSPPELRELVTAHVATVDELIALRQDLAPFVIARVVEEAAHPDSDHLHVTRVDMGTGTLLDVVCGAPNVRAGKLYPFAPTGTVMPSGLTIQKRKIRGAISDGMLCSARELGLGEEHDGILELDIDVPPGTPLLRALPLGDTQLVIDVGANRPDLLSHLGIAREVAALTNRPLMLPAIENLGASIPAAERGADAGRADSLSVRVAEPGLVHRFMGVVIRGVKIGPSPSWLVARLEAVGSRSINNVVDASNYVLHELGQPTHAFDLAKLGGDALIVRRAASGERITTLDGADRVLRDDMIVIADAQRPQAVAGVMGGRDSEVTNSTRDIFIEVANFDRGRVRTTRRALGLSTDASYRFERGVDVELGPKALERVAQIIMLVAGGSVAGAPVDLSGPSHTRASRESIVVRPSRVARVLGSTVPTSEIETLLTGIGFDVRVAGEHLRVTPPSWRQDVSAEVDLIEEVARLRGYDSFPMEIRPFRAGTVLDDPAWITAKRVRETLVGAGMLELRPMPFVAGGDGFVRVTNPLAENEAYLRRSVLDSLARRAEYNLARMQGNLRLFEIGAAFEPSEARLPTEEMRVAVLVMGRRQPPHFTDPKSSEFTAWAMFDDWDAKALAAIVARAAYPSGAIVLVPNEPQESAASRLTGGDDSNLLWWVDVGGRRVGVVRRLKLDAPVWAAPAFGVEVSLGVMASDDVAPVGKSAYRAAEKAREVERRFVPLPSMPASEFDLALSVPDGVHAERVEAVMRRVSGKLLESVELFDRYVGAGVEPGYRSLAWRLTFRHSERTLRDRELDARRSDILRALADELNVRQRVS